MSLARLARMALLVAATSAAVPGVASAASAPAAPQAPAPPPGETAPAQEEPPAGPVVGLPAIRVKAIEVVLTNAISQIGTPGLSVAIAYGDELVFANGYGFADIENFVSAKADTVYRLASISKTLTATLVLKLAEEGRLNLEAPVQVHCPAFPVKRWVVTPRQLLAHQAGIRHYRDGEQPMTRRFATLEEGLALFKRNPLEFEPDTGILYSTYGYTVLGCVVEGATEQPFAEALKERILVPAGMTRTQPDDLRALIPNRARGYSRSDQGRLVNAALADMSHKVPGGGLSGTTPDLARFGLALVSGRLLEPESLKRMLTRQWTRGGNTENLGLGLYVEERDGRREAWQDGNQTGASGVLYLRPDVPLVVALLVNHEGLAIGLLPLARRLADLVPVEPAATE